MIPSSWIAERYNASALFRLGFLLAAIAIAQVGVFALIEAAIDAWAPYLAVMWILLVAVGAAYLAVPRD